MHRRLFARLTSLAMVALVLLIGVGAALSGNLPSGVQDVVAEVAGAVGFDVPTSGDQGQRGTQIAHAVTQDATPRSNDTVQAVYETIDDYTTELKVWTTCVAEAAASQGNPQSDPDIRIEGKRFDPTAECGPKPKLNIPRPADDRFDGHRSDGTPDKPGRPDDPGRPSNPGKANKAGPPSEHP